MDMDERKKREIFLCAEWLLRFAITTASACASVCVAGAIFLDEFVRIFGHNFKVGGRHAETNEPRMENVNHALACRLSDSSVAQ